MKFHRFVSRNCLHHVHMRPDKVLTQFSTRARQNYLPHENIFPIKLYIWELTFDTQDSPRYVYIWHSKILLQFGTLVPQICLHNERILYYNVFMKFNRFVPENSRHCTHKLCHQISMSSSGVVLWNCLPSVHICIDNNKSIPRPAATCKCPWLTYC